MEEHLEKEQIHDTTQGVIDVEKDEYSIFNYLKEHHSLLIAIISGIMAIFSFLINIVNYMNINAYFMFWDIEISQITINSSNQIYSIITAFLFQAMLILATWFILNTYDSYRKRQQSFMYIKLKHRKAKKILKAKYKEEQKNEKRVLTLKQMSDKGHEFERLEEIEKIEKAISYTKNEIYTMKRELEEEYKGIQAHRNQDKKRIMISNIMAFVTVFLGCIIFFTTLVYYNNAIWAALFYAIVYVGINAAIHSGINYFSVKRELKKIIDNDEQKIVEIANWDSPIEKVIWRNWKLVISNRTVKSIIIQLIIITIAFMISFSYVGYSKAKSQKDFRYVISEEESYVVIYNNGDDLVMKKAFIDADNISIDLSVEKTISVNDVVIYKKSFSKVDIVRE